MLVRGIASFALFVITVSTLITAPAYAGPSDRRRETVTQAAVIAEVVHASPGKSLPKKLTRTTLKKRYGYQLERKFTLSQYRRLRGGKQFRVCVRHKRGGWATWNSATGNLKGKGNGRACRF